MRTSSLGKKLDVLNKKNACTVESGLNISSGRGVGVIVVIVFSRWDSLNALSSYRDDKCLFVLLINIHKCPRPVNRISFKSIPTNVTVSVNPIPRSTMKQRFCHSSSNICESVNLLVVINCSGHSVAFIRHLVFTATSRSSHYFYFIP